MFARVTTAMVRRESYEAALALFQATTLPIVRKLRGCRGVVSLGNRAENRVITMTLWASEQDRRVSGMNQEVIDNVAEFGPFVVGSFSRDQYDVVTDTWARGEATGDGRQPFARVTTTQLRLDNWDEGVALVREITDRPAGDPAGYRGSLALADPTTGKVLVVEVWDTRRALTAYEASVYLHDRVARERQVLAGSPAHALYRIATVDRCDNNGASEIELPA